MWYWLSSTNLHVGLYVVSVRLDLRRSVCICLDLLVSVKICLYLSRFISGAPVVLDIDFFLLESL